MWRKKQPEYSIETPATENAGSNLEEHTANKAIPKHQHKRRVTK